MQFQVPQYIDVEDKIFGPLSFKQFLYLGGGAGIGFLFYIWLPSYISYPLIVVFVSLGAALAFYQFNNRPFINTMEAALRYLISHKLYIWKMTKTKDTRTRTEGGVNKNAEAAASLKPGRLHELAWSLDVRENIK